MSYALQEVNLPILTVQNGSDLTFLDTTYLSYSWTTQNPAHMRFSNQSNYDLYTTMKLGGDTFWLRAGDSIVIPLTPGEVGFFYVCKNIYTSLFSNNLLYLTFFGAGEYILPLEDSVNAPTSPTSDYPPGANPFSSSSGVHANTTATATISGAAGKTSYLTGFEVTGSGATSEKTVDVTVTGLNGGTLHYTYSAVADTTGENTPLIVEFSKPLPASAVNTAISVSCPALGSGSTNNVVNVHGYQL